MSDINIYRLTHIATYVERQLTKKGINLRNYFADNAEFLTFVANLTDKVMLEHSPRQAMQLRTLKTDFVIFNN